MKYKYFSTFLALFGLFFSPFLANILNAQEDAVVFVYRNVDMSNLEESDYFYKKTNENVVFSFEKNNISKNVERTSLFIDPKDNSVNAVSVKIKYSKSDLKPKIIDNTDSDFSLFFVENVNENDGVITITYIEPFPGINQKAKIVDIFFENISNNQSEIYIEKESEVLANDGLGSYLSWELK